MGWNGNGSLGGLSFTYFIIPALHILSEAEVYENAI